MTLTDVLAALWAHKTEILLGAASVVAAASVLVKAADALLVVLVGIWPGLKGADDKLKHVAAWLDALASSKWLNALALNKATTKALLLALSVGLLSLPAPARASGFDWSSGPSLPLLEYDFGKPSPVQVAPGVGVQFSLTHDALKVDVLGKSWDAVSLNGLFFGSLVTSASGQQFGRLSLAIAPCFLSSLVCVGVGRHLLAEDSSFEKAGWFALLSLNFNFAVSPTAPASFDRDSWHLPRANTVYFMGGP